MHYVLFFLLPGFIFFKTIHKDTSWQDRTEQWPLLLKIAIVSIIIVLPARAAIIGIEALFPKDFWLVVTKNWVKFAGGDHSLEGAGTLLLAMFLAWGFGHCIQALYADSDKLNPVLDPYRSELTRLMEPEVLTMLETESGKVYFGDLTNATLDDHSEKVILIAPYFSGHRESSQNGSSDEEVQWEKVNKYLKIDTLYNQDQETLKKGKRYLKVMIPYREIISLREFDRDFFFECLDNHRIVFSKTVLNSLLSLAEEKKKQPDHPDETSH